MQESIKFHAKHNDFKRTQRRKTFKNILRQGENADDQHFLVLRKCFPSCRENFNYESILLFSNTCTLNCRFRGPVACSN